MTKTVSEWIKQGFKPHGPYQCRCPSCGKVISTNARARRNHQCPPKPETKKETA